MRGQEEFVLEIFVSVASGSKLFFAKPGQGSRRVINGDIQLMRTNNNARAVTMLIDDGVIYRLQVLCFPLIFSLEAGGENGSHRTAGASYHCPHRG